MKSLLALAMVVWACSLNSGDSLVKLGIAWQGIPEDGVRVPGWAQIDGERFPGVYEGTEAGKVWYYDIDGDALNDRARVLDDRVMLQYLRIWNGPKELEKVWLADCTPTSTEDKQ